jgi:hypothetical protein
MTKYIFVTGAPGSKWSSVVKNIYYSANIDRSDSTDSRQYYHGATGLGTPMHLGAYWDPGMEFDIPEDCSALSRAQAEVIFDRPFSGTGVRIVKSHVFGLQHNIAWLKQTWPDMPVVLVYRNSDSCLGWWYRCGGWDIRYPNYLAYYQNNANLVRQVERQNAGVQWAINKYPRRTPASNSELAAMLNIQLPEAQWQHCYQEHNIQVEII